MSYFDATDLWGGDPDKTNASIRHDFANSRITIGTGGEITNINGDYSITNQGFNVDGSASFLRRKAYTVGNNLGAFWGDNSQIILEARGLTGPDLLLNSVGGDINLFPDTAGSGATANMNGVTYFARWQQQEDETRQLSSTGQQSLTVGAPIVRLTSVNSTAVLSRITITNAPSNNRSLSFVLVNDSGTNFPIRDQSNTSFSGANIKTPAGVDRELQDGGRFGITYIASTGNFHISQDRT